MIVTIEIDTKKYDVRVTDKKTGSVWILEPEREMDGTVITPDPRPSERKLWVIPDRG